MKGCDGIWEGFAHWGGTWVKEEDGSDWGIVAWIIFGMAGTPWDEAIDGIARFWRGWGPDETEVGKGYDVWGCWSEAEIDPEIACVCREAGGLTIGIEIAWVWTAFTELAEEWVNDSVIECAGFWKDRDGFRWEADNGWAVVKEHAVGICWGKEHGRSKLLECVGKGKAVEFAFWSDGVVTGLGVDCGTERKGKAVGFGSVVPLMVFVCGAGGKGKAVWGIIWEGGVTGSGLLDDCTGGKGKAVGVASCTEVGVLTKPPSPAWFCAWSMERLEVQLLMDWQDGVGSDWKDGFVGVCGLRVSWEEWTVW